MSYKHLDFTEETADYEAFEEKQTINFNKCNHSNVTLKGHTLSCPCGASWEGRGVEEVYKLLKSQS